MKKNAKYVFFILMFFIIFLTFMHCFYFQKLGKKKEKEFFATLDGKKNFEEDTQNQRFQIYNQNFDATWKNNADSSNYPFIMDEPISYGDYKFLNLYKFFDFTNDQWSKILKDFGKIPHGFLKKNNSHPLLTPEDIRTHNKKTWQNRVKEYDANDYLYMPRIQSGYNVVNNLCDVFIKKLNYNVSLYFATLRGTDIQIIAPYFIYKYRLINKYQVKRGLDKHFYWGVVVVLIRNNSYIAPSFYLVAKTDHNEKIVGYMVDYIGNSSLDKYLNYSGYNKFDNVYQISPESCIPKSQNWIQPLEYRYMKAQIKHGRKQNYEPVKSAYACFAIDEKNPNNSNNVIYAIDKEDCLSRFEVSGKKKLAGVWDKPCTKNDDCIYFGTNKNYTNNRGKCLPSGKCELPVNMKNLGYHFYIDKKMNNPLCYNCKSDKWEATTNLDFCCEEQKDKKKYPFLEGPDYAFLQDTTDRQNYYKQKIYKQKIELK